jgi:hypothetical protein
LFVAGFLFTMMPQTESVGFVTNAQAATPISDAVSGNLTIWLPITIVILFVTFIVGMIVGMGRKLQRGV